MCRGTAETPGTADGAGVPVSGRPGRCLARLVGRYAYNAGMDRPAKHGQPMAGAAAGGCRGSPEGAAGDPGTGPRFRLSWTGCPRARHHAGVDVAELVLKYVQALVWPCVTLALVFVWRDRIADAIQRLQRVETPAGAVEFATDARDVRDRAEAVARSGPGPVGPGVQPLPREIPASWGGPPATPDDVTGEPSGSQPHDDGPSEPEPREQEPGVRRTTPEEKPGGERPGVWPQTRQRTRLVPGAPGRWEGCRDVAARRRSRTRSSCGWPSLSPRRS